jgi:hypothetical protein
MDIERGGILSSTPCLNTSALSVTEITSPSSCTLNHRFSFFPPLSTIKSQIIIYEKKKRNEKESHPNGFDWKRRKNVISNWLLSERRSLSIRGVCACVLTRDLFRKEREKKRRAPKSFLELPLLLWLIQIEFFEMMEKGKRELIITIFFFLFVYHRTFVGIKKKMVWTYRVV